MTAPDWKPVTAEELKRFHSEYKAKQEPRTTVEKVNDHCFIVTTVRRKEKT